MTNKIKICVISGSRAEYGLLSSLIKLIYKTNFFQLQLIVTGTHLSFDHGLTYKQILKDGFKIDGKVDLKIKNNEPIDIANQMSEALKGFGNLYKKLQPDIIVILGDRYEILCSSLVALLFNIPIAHIHGGEVTQGSIDNAFRHSITKMANFHFVSTTKSKFRILQLGEKRKNIFLVGSLGVENIKKFTLLKKEQLIKILKFDFDLPFLLITYHPETISNVSVENQISPLLMALNEIQNIRFIFTSSNSDVGGNIINNKILEFVKINKNAYFFKNLGHLNYLSVMRYSIGVVGNSSSGIIEAPAMNVPTINIGNRQTGRECGPSVINSQNEKMSILRSYKKILKIKKQNLTIRSLYERKNTSHNIIRILKSIDYKNIELKKFHDIKETLSVVR